MTEQVRRLGLLVPSSDAVTEMDFQRFLPPGVSFHTARLYHNDATPRGAPTLDELVAASEPAARTFLQVDPELIVFACTSGSFYKGYGWDREIAERLKAATGVPAVATTTAVVEALHALGLRRVFMVTPYTEEINRIEVQFLKDSGVEVVEYTPFHCPKSRDIANIAPSQVIERVLVHRDVIGRCDGVLISCTGLRGMEVAGRLETELGVPVATSNAATIWAVLHRLGVDGRGVRAGRLFALTR
jgi:maleate isomerase